MKNKLLIFALIAGVLISLPFISRQNVSDKVLSTYPWEITLLDSGLTRIFGLTPGQSTLADTRRMIGESMKLALLSVDNEPGSVEMYYSHFTAGRLSGRLIIVADLNQDVISSMRQRALRSGGANSFRIHSDDLNTVMQAPIRGITFIPIVDLDEEIITQRFGKADEIISKDNSLSHYLYPDKGLDIVLDSEGKEVLQYVAPHQFQQLVEPLKN
jgi:hypothetical protein